MKKIRWGILATGKIAHALAEALTLVEEAEIVAVGSRTQAAADAFGDRWHIPRRYASYEALAADPDLDVIYIATPHSYHYENMKLCLSAGKHVLCEKPLTLNAQEAAECVALAREKRVFLMEAVWMRFFPAIAQVRDWVAQGTIGDIRLVQADFCFNLPFDPTHRLYHPALGGGALLDLGIYPLSFATMLLGFPDEIDGRAHIGRTGVDELNTMTLTYHSKGSSGDITAQLSSSMRIYKPREAFVVGTAGYIKIHDTFFCPHTVTRHRHGRDPETIHLPPLGNCYPHEIMEVHRCLRAGQLESTIMPLDDTVRLMALMDELRGRWGIRYPGENE